MLRENDQLKEYLKSKTALLLKRERELFEFRRMHDRVAIWLKIFLQLELAVKGLDVLSILQKWTNLMVDELDYQAAVVVLLNRADEASPLVVKAPSSVSPVEIHIEPEALSFLGRGNAGTYDKGEPAALGRLSENVGLEKFHWSSVVDGEHDTYLLMAGFSPQTAKSHPIFKNDESHFSMLSRHVALLIDNAGLISDVESERADLRETNKQLDKSLRELTSAQEELIRSTRLASVGEMAGRTAHEVLNPITSIHGRTTTMLNAQDKAYRANLDILEEIVSAWYEAYQTGGSNGLFDELSREVKRPGGNDGTLLSDDLHTLKKLVEYFSQMGESYANGFRFLLREVDRVVHIIDGMRSLARQSGTQTHVSISHILNDVAEIHKDSLDKRNIELQLVCDREPMVYLDRYELIQVLTNLLRNAMLAIEEKCGRYGGQLDVRAQVNGERVEIRIEDTGAGIKKEHVPLIFESDFTTRSSQKGTGLGLGIARRLTRGFGGDLTLEKNEEGIGCTFLLELPCSNEAGEDRP